MAENPRTAQHATIKRATLAAHKAMDRLDTQSIAELEAVYQQAAQDIAARIAQHAGPDGNLTLQEMRSALQQVNAELARLSEQRNAVLNVSIERAANLGVQPYLAQGPGVTATLDPGAGMRVANEAVRFVRNFVAEDGLQLSDRLWRIDAATRDGVVNAIERAVIQGNSASRAAMDMLERGIGVPAELQAKINAANAQGISKAARQQLIAMDESGALYNAERVMRTEINRAHGEAYMAGGEDHPDFGGWKYLLSPAHPKPDICDLLSTQNLHGLGPGVYPTRAKLPWPAHPNTLSYIEIVFKDEITEADRAGKQTPIDALNQLTPAQQRGVLGKGKQELLASGQLRQGMIRTPLSRVRARIGADAPVRTPLPRAAVQAAPRTLDEMIKAGGTKVDELLKRLKADGADPAERFAAALYRDLKTKRGLDKPVAIVSRGEGANLVQSASRVFPDDWTALSARRGPLKARISEGRAHYRDSDGKGNAEIKARDFQSAVHELAHRLQHAIPELDDFYQDLHFRRTEGDRLKRLRDLLPGHGYKSSEITQEDQYINPYQGRIYKYNGRAYEGKHGALEVMTMAFETVLGDKVTPRRRMLEKDREMIDLTVGLLYNYVPKI